MDEDEPTNVRVIGPYVLEVTLADGRCARVDVEQELYGPAFEPLRDPSLFAQGKFDPEAGTVVWPSGADFSPEYLIEAALAASSRGPA